MSDAPEITIKGISPWFGSKRTLGPRIVAEFGPHRAYWEVFCGSMAPLMSKPACAMETVNDLHGDLINLARVIKDDKSGPMLYRRLRRTLLCREFVREAAQGCRARWGRPAPDSPDVDAAYEFFIYSWLGANGVAGTESAMRGGFNIRYTSGGGSTNKRWGSVISNISAWRHRLRHVIIANVHARALIPRIEDRKGTVIYLDPPYIVKGAEYVHDFSGVEEDGALFAADPDRPLTHGELAELVKPFKHTRVVVSYYDHPVVRRLYKGWTFVECTVAKSLVNQGMRDAGEAVEAPEVLIVNGPSFTEGSDGH